MIVGIYSDLHANWPAMEAMVVTAGPTVDRWLCAGDSVGLFPCINEVLDRQRQLRAFAVRGDHETLLLSGEPMTDSYTGNQALVAQRAAISRVNHEYLSSLEDTLDIELDGVRIRLTHYLDPKKRGSEHKYRFDQKRLDDLYADFDFVVFGHTHLATVLYGRSVIALNPGSAGFPVDAGRKPSALLLDTKTGGVEFLRFEGDSARLKVLIQEAGYNPKLSQYLDNGYCWS